MRTCLVVLISASLLYLSGCTVVKVVDTAASAAIGTASTAVKVTGKVVDAAIPDGEDEESEE